VDSYARFIAVADLGTISRAAERLNLSQPALSGSIALLEQRFGTRLFHRRAGGM
jgi:DNA-binding transcriptional LysR family regulator